MTITKSQTATGALAQSATGKYTDDAATPAKMTITLGFSPQHIRVTNLTTRVAFEWMLGMAVGESLKSAAAGTRTLETDTAIVINLAAKVKANDDDPTQPDVPITFDFYATGIAQNDKIYWQVTG